MASEVSSQILAPTAEMGSSQQDTPTTNPASPTPSTIPSPSANDAKVRSPVAETEGKLSATKVAPSKKTSSSTPGSSSKAAVAPLATGNPPAVATDKALTEGSDVVAKSSKSPPATKAVSGVKKAVGTKTSTVSTRSVAAKKAETLQKESVAKPETSNETSHSTSGSQAPPVGAVAESTFPSQSEIGVSVEPAETGALATAPLAEGECNTQNCETEEKSEIVSVGPQTPEAVPEGIPGEIVSKAEEEGAGPLTAEGQSVELPSCKTEGQSEKMTEPSSPEMREGVSPSLNGGETATTVAESNGQGDKECAPNDGAENLENGTSPAETKNSSKDLHKSTSGKLNVLQNLQAWGKKLSGRPESDLGHGSGRHRDHPVASQGSQDTEHDNSVEALDQAEADVCVSTPTGSQERLESSEELTMAAEDAKKTDLKKDASKAPSNKLKNAFHGTRGAFANLFTKTGEKKGASSTDELPAKAAAGNPTEKPGKMEKPPRWELVANKDWIIENYHDVEGINKIEEGAMNQGCCISACSNVGIEVCPKINNIVMTNCHNVRLLFSSLISSLDMNNCTKCSIQVTGRCAGIQVDRVADTRFYLSATSRDVSIAASEISNINVMVPRMEATEEDDLIEIPVPQQFIHTIVGDSISSRVSDLYH